MLSHAILAVIAARELTHRTDDTDALVPLTVNEIPHLFARLNTNHRHSGRTEVTTCDAVLHFGLDIWGETGGQGVVGSNPAVPTRNRR
jgi:hypothetical protein